MEKELNIAAILKDKPKNTKLWTYIYGDVYLDGVNNIEGIKLGHHGVKAFLLSSGKAFEDGEVCIFPSKEMRSWEKFAWKKGDVLASNNVICVFGGFRNDDYTKFNALNAICISPYDNKNEAICSTADFSKVESDKDIKNYLLNSQVIFGNIKLPACDIEQPKQEFKDGDIVAFGESVAICKKFEEDKLYFYACIDDLCGLIISDSVYTSLEYRLATDPEKQKFFDALAKENKRWNPDTKQIEDLPKKCELKQMDLCLMSEGYDGSLWSLCQFAFKDVEGFYYSIGGGIWRECIPYNDSTKHLLGTTDEWEGGEL